MFFVENYYKIWKFHIVINKIEFHAQYNMMLWSQITATNISGTIKLEKNVKMLFWIWYLT